MFEPLRSLFGKVWKGGGRGACEAMNLLRSDYILPIYINYTFFLELFDEHSKLYVCIKHTWFYIMPFKTYYIQYSFLKEDLENAIQTSSKWPSKFEAKIENSKCLQVQIVLYYM